MLQLRYSCIGQLILGQEFWSAYRGILQMTKARCQHKLRASSFVHCLGQLCTSLRWRSVHSPARPRTLTAHKLYHRFTARHKLHATCFDTNDGSCAVIWYHHNTPHAAYNMPEYHGGSCVGLIYILAVPSLKRALPSLHARLLTLRLPNRDCL